MSPAYTLMKRFDATLLCALFLALSCSASAQLFQGFGTAGATFSQVDGDQLAGYNRLGGYAGIGVLTDLSDKWRTSLTIAYSQNGSSASRNESGGTRLYDNIKLDYVAVPVVAHYMDWLSNDADYYRLEFVAGLEYRRLITARATGGTGEDLTDFNRYRNNTVAFTGGVLYAWSLKWAAGFHYSRGLTDAQANSVNSAQNTKQLSLRLRRLF